MARIPRIIFGFHLAVVGVAFLLVVVGGWLQWFDRAPGLLVLAICVAGFVLVRPYFVVTPDGLRFVARILWLVSIPYASIDRRRILSIRVGWDREDVVKRGVHYRRPVLGIFLECLRKDGERVATFCIQQFKDMDTASEKAEQYARILECPVQKWTRGR